MKHTQDYFLGFAISEYLSSWEDSLTNQEIIEAIRNDDSEQFSIWEPFEHYPVEEVADLIEALAERLFRTLG